MGTNVEWSHVALFVAAITMGVVCWELFIELVGVKNNPRESLVYLRHGVLFSLLFSMIHVFRDRLLHGALLLFVIGVAALGSARRSAIKNNLTEPTLLEMSGNALIRQVELLPHS